MHTKQIREFLIPILFLVFAVNDTYAADNREYNYTGDRPNILSDIKERKNAHLAPTFQRMARWYVEYINNDEKILSVLSGEQHYLELIAEATYWSVELGLDEYFKAMSFEQLMEFQPILLTFKEPEIPFARKISEVIKKLEKPSMSLEISYALQQAANSCYAKVHSYSKFLEQYELYTNK